MTLDHMLKDIDRWNDLPEEVKARWLNIGIWDAYNLMMERLPSEWKKTLQTHEDFRPLRIAYTLCRTNGDRLCDVMRVTDMLSDAIAKLNGQST